MITSPHWTTTVQSSSTTLSSTVEYEPISYEYHPSLSPSSFCLASSSCMDHMDMIDSKLLSSYHSGRHSPLHSKCLTSCFLFLHIAQQRLHVHVQMVPPQVFVCAAAQLPVACGLPCSNPYEYHTGQSDTPSSPSTLTSSQIN